MSTEKQESTRQKLERQNKKVGELYIEALADYQKKFDKDSLVVLMQVGDFFEMYGLIYPDGKHVGNLWTIAEQLGLDTGEKKQLVYDDPSIQLIMAGVPEKCVNKYIQMAVEKFQWTVVIFEQRKIGTSGRYERHETAIISPGINIDSDGISNVCMNIYIEQVKDYVNLSTIGKTKNGKLSGSSNSIINIGISFVDCLTGDNGVLNICNNNIKDTAIPFDEILKILTIKKPNELIINLINCDIEDADLINAIHLFKFNYKINRNEIDSKYENIIHQKELFNTIYNRQKGLMDIMQQLDLDGPEFLYGRISLSILLEYIMKHDKTIINKLNKPTIIANSNKYLMLANNCLEQLDIIDNYKANYQSNNEMGLGRRISLYDMLDRTKTTMGKRYFRQRLSTPITDPKELNLRYKQVEEFLSLEKKYFKKHTDSSKSPIGKTCAILSQIKNIEKYLRKMITNKIYPSEIKTFYNSINKCLELKKYLLSVESKCKESFDTKKSKKETQSKDFKKFASIIELIPDEKVLLDIAELLSTIKKELIFDNCPFIWSTLENNMFHYGVFPRLDVLQTEIEVDRNLMNNLVTKLNDLIKENADKKNPDANYVNLTKNAKLGTYLYVNTTRKAQLERALSRTKRNIAIQIGKYKFYAKDITFLKMKESKWQICINQLKISGGTLKHNMELLIQHSKKLFKDWMANLTEKYISQIEILSDFVANIDVIQSIANVSFKNGYCKPKIVKRDHNHSYLKAEQIRHPIIEYIHKNTKYIPNDVELGSDTQSGILLFGLNAVGKSSCMKSIGINIIMAQAGLYVACSNMTYYPYNYLFTRIKNNDNIYAGLSSFEVEMKEFKVILRYADENSIILGDELCSGTETQDATALVASGVMQLSERNSSFIFATHLHFLADMPYIKKLDNVKLYHLLVEKDLKDPSKLIYTRKLQPGNGPRSYGILVCESMNLDEKFIESAKEIRESMNLEKDLNQLEFKTSKYNSKKNITNCEICHAEGLKVVAEDVHHINQQCNADGSGMIDGFHKNEKWNLVSLCKDCHMAIHAKPKSKIKVNGYIQTNNGIVLDFKRIKKLTKKELKERNLMAEYTKTEEDTNKFTHF